MRKVFRILFTAIFGIILTAGCLGCGNNTDGTTGGSDIPPVDPTKSITLKIQSAAPLKSNYTALLLSEQPGSKLYNHAMFTKKLIDGFKEIYPNIKLQFVDDGWGDALYQQQQLYIRNFNSGGAMAVDIMIGEQYLNYFAKNNVFIELDKSKFTDVLEGARSDVYIDDKLYGVPMTAGIFGLQYNTAILQECGIPEADWVPSTWAELKENARKVSEYSQNNDKSYSGIIMNNINGTSSAFRALSFMRQAGGDFVDAGGNLTVNSESNIAAYNYMRELAQYALPASLTETSEDALQIYFTNGNKSAYMIDGQWSMANAPANIKSAPLPKKDSQSTIDGNCFIGGLTFAIARGSKNISAAQAFLQFISGAEFQMNVLEYDGRLPINKTVLSCQEIREVYPNINPYIDMLKEGTFKGTLYGFTKNSSDIWSMWGTFNNKLLTSQDDITVLANNLQNTISEKM